MPANSENLAEATGLEKASFHFNPKESESVKVKSLSCVRLFATPWTAAYQAPPSIAFSRQEYWSGLPFPSPGDLPNPGIEPGFPALQADSLPSEPPVPEAMLNMCSFLTYYHQMRWILLYSFNR